ncbi:MFS transporter [Apibacter muscae]|uniref:MFS transporter n=1 Tax=Apibacter muscae TaxID=2509004 RepID=UPI0011AD6770|nr:MFS transporter [Apibacter muscae]TWP29511.1 MFS transporter [Apibacter muscae]
MINRHIFRKDIPRWLMLAVAYIIMAPVMLINGAYTGSSVDISSSLGVMSEDINMAYFSTSAGMSIAYPLIIKLRKVVTQKVIILWALLMQVFLSLLCAEVNNMVIITLCSFFIGFFKALALLEIIMILMPMLSPDNHRGIFYSKFYPVTLGLSQLSMVLTSELAYRYNWQYMYYFMIALLLIAMIAVLLTFKYTELPKKIPLKDADWLSVFLCSIIYISIIYVFTYGKTFDWFNSTSIFVCTFFIIPIAVILFIKRQLIKEDSYIDLSILKNTNTSVGYLVMFICMFYVSASVIVSSYVTSVLRLESNRLYELYIITIPGFILGAIVCWRWFNKERRINLIIFFGFLCLVSSCAILYFTVSPNGQYSLLYIPMFLRGTGMIVTFVVFGVYVVQGLHPDKFIYNVFFLIGIRSALSPAISSSIYSNTIYRLQQQYVAKLSESINNTNPLAVEKYNQYYHTGVSKGFGVYEAQQYALSSINSLVQIQALTLTLKTILGWLTLLGIFILLLVLIYPFNNHKKLKFIKWRKSMGY